MISVEWAYFALGFGSGMLFLLAAMFIDSVRSRR